jgi:hypothetical protein
MPPFRLAGQYAELVILWIRVLLEWPPMETFNVIFKRNIHKRDMLTGLRGIWHTTLYHNFYNPVLTFLWSLKNTLGN